MEFEQVIVLNPPSPLGYVANKDSMGGFGQLFPRGAVLMPPLDLAYLAGFLASKDVPLRVVEAQGEGLEPEAFVSGVVAIVGRQPSLCVARTSAPSLDWDLSLLDSIKLKAPAAATAIYGPIVPHIVARAEREPRLDFVIRGEPDETVWELACGRPQDEILGLGFRADGEFKFGLDRPFNRNLDDLPFPAWELLPYKRYTLPRSSTTKAVPFLPMLTSRGCPYGCNYCPYPVGQGLNWRYRTPQNVVDEIEHLVRDLGVRYILFRDPMFSMRPRRVVEICEEIQRRSLKVRWKCETRFDRLDEPTLRAMAMAGCEGVNFGIESVDVDIQANVGRKPIPPETIIEIVALCRRLKIKVFCFFIVGLPGDTRTTILDSIAFALSLRPNWVQFTAASPFIGTRLRGWALEQGLIGSDEYAYVNSHEAMIGNENLSKREIALLLGFAKFFERFVINRGGIFKDDRRGGVYAVGRECADALTQAVGRAAFAIGRAGLRRKMPRFA